MTALRRSLMLAGAVACACRPAGDTRGGEIPAAIPGDSMGTVVPAREIPVRLREDLVEASGVMVSASQPGVVFLINDSGHEPVLFAVDTAGNDRGSWQIGPASNIDWEAASTGPCSRTENGEGPAHCLYVGDVGDNASRYPTRTLYRFPEPPAQRSGYTGRLSVERLVFTYQGGPRDVEALYVGPDGTVYLLSKRAVSDSAGRLRPALVFALLPAEWGRRDSPAMARLVDSLPVVPGSSFGRFITDAALSPDARYVAVRTYDQVFVFLADSAGAIRTALRPSVCNIGPLRERQGEGVAWLGESRLLLVSEGRQEPFRIVTCPLPPPGVEP